MPDPEPNRRWFQFSLCLLLLVVVAGNVFWWGYQVHMDQIRLSERLAVDLKEARSQARQSADLATRYESDYAKLLDHTMKISAAVASAPRRVSGGSLTELQREIAELKARLKECGCADK